MAAITSRYARAFADVVFANQLDAAKTLTEIEQLARLIANSAELSNVFDNPAVPHPQKLKLLDALVARSGMEKPVRNFAAILMDNRRLGALPQITEQLKREIDSRLGFAEVEVISARELGADERAALESQLAKVTGRKLRAQYNRDARLLGGVIARIGSTVYDGSVRGQLERMKAEIAG